MTSRKWIFKLPILLLFIVLPFQNCSAPVNFQNASIVYDSLGRPIFKGQLTVTPSKPNPPLKLFFVVDNSASMLGHQIDLGTQFGSLFQNASASLQGFDTTIYVFSTASTFNTNLLSQIPSRAPSSISSVPSASDTANLALVPGNIFSYWNNATGNFGTAPFSTQISPAPVLDNVGGAVSAQLFIGRKGSSSDADYNTQIAAVTDNFKSRLSYLNPTNQANYANLTDVSSGLCSIARIVHHSSDYIQPGDSTAFIIASDDDDRMNVRNPNGNSCVESVVGNSNLINGNCGHYQTNFSYSNSSLISYYNSRKFNYESGTYIPYSYPSSETCTISYRDGYSYSSTYTALQTVVSYTECDSFRDGTCVASHPTTHTISGSYTGPNSTCTQDLSGAVPQPAPGTTYSCAAQNLPNQNGPSGVDGGSNGSACSANLVNSLQAGNKSNVVCNIGGAHIQTGYNTSAQAIGACSNFCNANATQFPMCSRTATTGNNSYGSIQISSNGVQCADACPNASQCGSGTVINYIKSLHPTAVCGSSSPTSSSMSVNSGANSDGTQLSCASVIGDRTVTANGANVCGGNPNMTILQCANSLQSGNTSANTACTVDNSTAATLASIPLNDSCTTTCANSGGYCNSAQYTTVADYLARSLHAYCGGSQPAGSAGFSLTFTPAVSQNASCSSKCADATSGSCDGLGFGAADNSTVADYVRSKGGGATCNSSVQYIAESSSAGANAANPQASCPAGKFFSPTSGVYAGTAINYTTGDANHNSADFINYISSGSPQSTIAVITQLPGDNLYGTSVGQQYINLATKMNSDQVSSITAHDYSSALNNISDFIVKSAMNSFILPLDPANFVYGISVLHQGSQVWQPIDSSQWRVAGLTLSINPSVNLQIGDQLLYQYRLTQ